MTSATKTLSVEQMRRLTLVRHLYNTAVIQSREADVRSGLAILPFHDAAEMFLQLACERHEASQKKKAEFTDYWSWLADKGVKLTQSEGMGRLNKVRVSLKHHGILPALPVLEGLRAEITNFFQDNTPIAFDIRFDQISLTSLITNQEISQLLVEAETALTAADHVTALEKAKTAFVLTLRKYEENARLPSHQVWDFTPMSAARHLSTFDGDHLSEALEGPASRSAKNIADTVKVMAGSFSEAIMVIGYGLDFHAYLSFKANTPVSHEIYDGGVILDWPRKATDDAGVVQQCISFAVDTAIRLKI